MNCEGQNRWILEPAPDKHGGFAWNLSTGEAEAEGLLQVQDNRVLLYFKDPKPKIAPGNELPNATLWLKGGQRRQNYMEQCQACPKRGWEICFTGHENGSQDVLPGEINIARQNQCGQPRFFVVPVLGLYCMPEPWRVLVKGRWQFSCLDWDLRLCLSHRLSGQMLQMAFHGQQGELGHLGILIPSFNHSTRNKQRRQNMQEVAESQGKN